VLNVDDQLLERLARELAVSRRVVRASGSSVDADVAVLARDSCVELRVAGKSEGITGLAPGAASPIASNAACAAAVALELGIDPSKVVSRLSNLPSAPNRLQRYEAEAGYVVLDDTFNSNPAGARLALDALGRETSAGRRVLVTPGMVELGRTQRAENADFAEQATGVVTDVVVVGRTNRAALVEGCHRAARQPWVKLVSTREEAVAWARTHLGSGDVVLFENDLPDHFP